MINLLTRNGNACRIAGRYQEAEKAFADAFRRIRVAPLSTCLEAGQLYSMMASLRLEQFRPHEARDLLRKAHSIATGYGDRRLLARVLHKQGIAADDLGHPRHALDLLLDAKRIYREDGDVKSEVLVLNEAVLVLAGAGEVDRALRLYLMIQDKARELLDPRALRSFSWTHGVIALRAGLHEAADKVFSAVMEDAAEQGDTVVAAGTLLYAAEARAGLGDFVGVEEAAVRLAALFEALGVPACVMAAADLLRQAARCRLTALAECVRTVRNARRMGRC